MCPQTLSYSSTRSHKHAHMQHANTNTYENRQTMYEVRKQSDLNLNRNLLTLHTWSFFFSFLFFSLWTLQTMTTNHRSNLIYFMVWNFYWSVVASAAATATRQYSMKFVFDYGIRLILSLIWHLNDVWWARAVSLCRTLNRLVFFFGQKLFIQASNMYLCSTHTDIHTRTHIRSWALDYLFLLFLDLKSNELITFAHSIPNKFSWNQLCLFLLSWDTRMKNDFFLLSLLRLRYAIKTKFFSIFLKNKI